MDNGILSNVNVAYLIEYSGESGNFTTDSNGLAILEFNNTQLPTNIQLDASSNGFYTESAGIEVPENTTEKTVTFSLTPVAPVVSSIYTKVTLFELEDFKACEY